MKENINTLIYCVLISALVLHGPLFSTTTVYLYREQEDKRFIYASADYFGKLLTHNKIEIDCDISKENCKSIDSCKYQALLGLIITALLLFVHYSKKTFLLFKFQNNPTDIHTFVLFFLLIGALNSFSIPAFRYSFLGSIDKLIITPILLELEIGILFLTAFVLELYLMIKVKPGDKKLLQNQVIDQ